MAWWEWLVGILLFIVALGVLIGIHELGHLGAAKLFHVYCFNYSIGFGPTIISSKRSKKHETIWSLRAIPLGGFVAMYGEGVEVEEGLYVPPSRSLEGIARYKRAIIVAAGVFLNFILGFVLIFISNACFDHAYVISPFKNDFNRSSIVVSITNEEISKQGFTNEDALKYTIDPITSLHSNIAFFVLSEEDSIKINGEQYVLGFLNSLPTTKTDPKLNDVIALYKAIDIKEASKNVANNNYSDERLISVLLMNETCKSVNEAKEYIKDLNNEQRKSKYQSQLEVCYQKRNLHYAINTEVKYNIDSTPLTLNNINLSYFKKISDKEYNPESKSIAISISVDTTNKKWNDIGINFKIYRRWYSIGEDFQTSWEQWCSSNTTIFRALGRLFTGDTSNIGGIIAIATQSSQTLSNFGFGQYLYLWGMISCNLAIINLLPIPALDGFSLVVIVYEGISKKQIPTKVKAILSFVGFIFIAMLMVAVIVKDIVRLI